MEQMTTQQKYEILAAFDQLEFDCRADLNDWFVRWDDVCLRTDTMTTAIMGNGTTPQEAIDDLWDKIMMMPPNYYLATPAFASDSQMSLYRWNGFMWKKYK